MSASKITQAELIDLFGETIPMEVVNLIFGPSSEKMTIGEVRAEIRKIYAATISQLQAEIARYREALTPFARYMDGGIDLDNHGKPLPGDQGVGWVYLTHDDFRRARAALGGSNDH